MRRSILPVSVLLLSGLAIYACGSDTLAPTESGIVPGPSGSVATTSDGSGGDTTDDSALQRNKPDFKVDICHIPQGNPDNAQLLSLSPSAEDMHRTKHGDVAPGDPVPGMAGYEFDADCVPVLIPPSGVSCPCDLSPAALVAGIGFSGGQFLFCDASAFHWQDDSVTDAGRVEAENPASFPDASCRVIDFAGTGSEFLPLTTTAQYDACLAQVTATAATVGAVCS